MDCLLISGFINNEKTTTCIRLGNLLLRRGYRVTAGDAIPAPGFAQDFCSVMEHETSRRRLMINSRSVLEGNAAALLALYREQASIDVLITAIRDGRIERQWVWDVVLQLASQQTVEVPLARVTGSDPILM